MSETTTEPATAPTFAELVAARAEDDHTALWFEERSWTWREVVAEARRRADLARSLRRPGPWHIGVFCENSPEHLFWWLGAALAGATVVGLNPTRRDQELVRDITFTDCQLVVTDAVREPLLAGLDLPVPAERVVRVDDQTYAEQLAAAPEYDLPTVDPDTTLSLIFTSGTTSAPKAVVCSQARMGRIAQQQQERRSLSAADTFYVVMPMFHSNSLMAGIAPAVRAAGTVVLRRRFSASAFLPDVRRYGVTFFNYVGKPLNYLLATPEHPDDADNPLRIAFGNEASERDIAEFSRRFGCTVIDSFGSSEGEIQIMRVPDAPPGSLGVAAPGTVVLDSDTLEECPPATFDANGRMRNPDEAIGEIVNKNGAALFEGYYKNPEAEAERLRHGWVWSGDLAYRDADGYWYFGGRTSEWLRVDGENLSAAPIERLLARSPAITDVAVYAVPDAEVGDQVMAAVVPASDHAFDPAAFAEFLAAQADLGQKWAPRYIRVLSSLPRTASNKVLKRSLQQQAWHTEDPVFVRHGRELVYEPLSTTSVSSAVPSPGEGAPQEPSGPAD